jgi:glycosyltransferase involved in cell wall biosynthesis
MTIPLRVYYMAGAGDVITSFEHWRKGEDDPRITAVAYSSQFFDVCRELGAELWAVSTYPQPGIVREGGITVEHRGDPLAGKSGLAYHWAHLSYARQVIADIRAFRANVAVVGAEPYPFLLEPLRSMGVNVIAGMHCVLWPKHGGISAARRSLLKLSADFYRTQCKAILSISSDVNAQVQDLVGGSSSSIVDFRPLFRKHVFEALPPPQPRVRPFRVFFAGRVEHNKGVFDLLEVAERLQKEGRSDVEFDLCGTGAALDELQSRVSALGLERSFRLHGYCKQQRIRELLGRSHLVAVPTRSDFIEGLNKVVVEGVLAGRPVVTSTVCPAVHYVRGAVVEVEPDNPSGYYDAICRLADDGEHYAQLQTATHGVAVQFLDDRYSYKSAVRHVLLALREGQTPAPVSHPPPNAGRAGFGSKRWPAGVSLNHGRTSDPWLRPSQPPRSVPPAAPRTSDLEPRAPQLGALRVPARSN